LPRPRERVHAILWPVLLVLAGIAAAVEPAVERLLPPVGAFPPPFGDALLRYGSDWLLWTLPVVAAGALAAVLGRRSSVRPAWGLPAWLVAGSTLVEIIGGATWSSVLGAPGLGILRTIYALSSVLMATAWLTVRGWRPLALLTSLFAGLASWLTMPIDLDGIIRDWLGTGRLAIFVTFIVAYTVQALVIGVAVVAGLAWRRVQPTVWLLPDVP
jgi:hypothetical protein